MDEQEIKQLVQQEMIRSKQTSPVFDTDARLLREHRHEGFDNSKKLSTEYPVEFNLYNTDPATAGNYDRFWTAPWPCLVIKVTARWSTASTSGTLQIERLQETEASGAGDTLLASTIDMSGTANTVNEGTLVSTSVEALALNTDDGLGAIDGGDLTSLVNLTVIVLVKRIV